MKNKVVNNLSWMLVCRISQALLGLVITSFVTRYLGPTLYGVISYAASVAAFFLPLSQLGFREVLVQQTVDHPEDEGEIYGTSVLVSALTALACMVGMMCFVFVVDADKTDTIIVFALYSFSLLFQSLELIRFWFQAKYLSRYIAFASLAVYGVTFLYKGAMILLKQNVYWFAIGDCIGYLFVSLVLFAVYFKMGGQRLAFSKSVLKRIFVKSKYYIISSMMVTIFAQTDKIMINMMIGDEATGYYSAASNTATITAFLFCAVIDSILPMIFENRKKSLEAFNKSVSLLYCIIIYLSLLQSVGMTLLATPIIYVLYGGAYVPAVSLLRVCVWFTTFSYMGAVRDVWLLSNGLQKYMWRINLSGALFNVVLNVILITYCGAMGAAIASVITQFFTNVVTGMIIKPIRPSNGLIIKGLNPVLIKEFIKEKNN